MHIHYTSQYKIVLSIHFIKHLMIITIMSLDANFLVNYITTIISRQ